MLSRYIPESTLSKALLAFGIFAVVVVFTNIFIFDETAATAPTQVAIAKADVKAPADSARNTDIIEWITSRPEIYDATVTSSNYLYIGVRRGEKNWLPYTTGVCNQLRLRGVTTISAVKAVDIDKIRAKRGFDEIETSYC